MLISRRSLLIAAPAVILTPKLLMPVRPWSFGNSYLSLQGFDTSGDLVEWEVTNSGRWSMGDMIIADGRWWQQKENSNEHIGQ